MSHKSVVAAASAAEFVIGLIVGVGFLLVSASFWLDDLWSLAIISSTLAGVSVVPPKKRGTSWLLKYSVLVVGVVFLGLMDVQS